MRTKGQNDLGRVIFLFGMLAMVFVLIFDSISIEAQEVKFPSKSVEIICPMAPGGSNDVLLRILAEDLSKELGAPVVVKNITGGAGLMGSTAFLSTKPDGHTLLSASGSCIVSSVQLSKTPPFDPRKDMLPVGLLVEIPVAMSVPKNSPFKTFEEFIQFAKNNPGKLKGGVSSLGGETHIMFISIIRNKEIETKMIPHKGTGDLAAAILGGHIDWMTLSLPATMRYAKSGDVRILLLSRKSPELPDVPTGADVGLPELVSMWVGLLVLPQTPKVAYDRLVSALNTVCNDPVVVKKLTDRGFIMAYKNPEEFSKLINDHWDLVARVIKEAEIKVD